MRRRNRVRIPFVFARECLCSRPVRSISNALRFCARFCFRVVLRGFAGQRFRRCMPTRTSVNTISHSAEKNFHFSADVQLHAVVRILRIAHRVHRSNSLVGSRMRFCAPQICFWFVCWAIVRWKGDGISMNGSKTIQIEIYFEIYSNKKLS